MSIAKKIFRGFTTRGRLGRDTRAYDIDLIKIDLYNHFHTRIGERRGRPGFGCKIWDYHFEQMTADVIEDIENEVERVCAHDSRVVVLNKVVTQYANGISVEIELEFLPSRVVDTFSINFERRSVFA